MHFNTLIVIIVLPPCGCFEKMMSFTQIFNRDLEQGKLMAAVISNYCNRLKFGKISGQTYCVRKRTLKI